MAIADIAKLIEDWGESLQREMRSGFTEVNERLDRIETTLKRPSGTIVSGTVAIATLTRVKPIRPISKRA